MSAAVLQIVYYFTSNSNAQCQSVMLASTGSGSADPVLYMHVARVAVHHVVCRQYRYGLSREEGHKLCGVTYLNIVLRPRGSGADKKQNFIRAEKVCLCDRCCCCLPQYGPRRGKGPNPSWCPPHDVKYFFVTTTDIYIFLYN